jgi:hypothetical protein
MQEGEPSIAFDSVLAPGDTSAARPVRIRLPGVADSAVVRLAVVAPPLPPQNVPASAPDSIPNSVYAAANVSTNLSGLSGTYVRNIVTILFAPNTPRARRQAAVDAVGGRVIGGYRLPDGDGEYYVRLPDDGTAGPLLRAMDLLNGFPGVEAAGFESMNTAAAIAEPDPGPRRPAPR